MSDLAASARGLEGTGFTPPDVDDLLARLEESPLTVPEPSDPLAGLGEGRGDRQVRSMVLDFTLDDFRVAVDLAAAMRSALSVPSNAELFTLLVSEEDARYG